MIAFWQLCLLICLPDEQSAAGGQSLRTGGVSTYVHRLTLYDHDGAAISPSDEPARPYSPRMTCGKCHDYERIRHGWHFSGPQGAHDPRRPSEPWLLQTDLAGDPLAISPRDPQGVTPVQAGLSGWDVVRLFGRHLPGGGYGHEVEPVMQPDARLRKALKTSAPRWDISGELEIDCMICHSADMQHDFAEAVRQMEAENFRWAPTAAAGLAIVQGEARKLPDDFDPLAPPNPDYPDRNPPQVRYAASRFDLNDRVYFPVTRRPPAERCLVCHSVLPAESAVGERPAWRSPRDVHLVAGMTCTDCHRNDESHAIIRGYEGEAQWRNEPVVAAYSCAGCHLGVGAANSLLARSGTDFAAAAGSDDYAPRTVHPAPEHRGLPVSHLEKFTCTFCHSGLRPAETPHRVQTSRAHGLGLAEQGRRADQGPLIFESVLAAPAGARIGPYRVARVASNWISVGVDGENDASGRQAATSASRIPGEHRPAVGGAQPYYIWPVGHDVRPAVDALGARGCTDCHTHNSPVMRSNAFAAGVGAVAEDNLQPFDLGRQRVWASLMPYRSAFVVLSGVAVLLMAARLLQLRAAGDSRAGSNSTPIARGAEKP